MLVERELLLLLLLLRVGLSRGVLARLPLLKLEAGGNAGVGRWSGGVGVSVAGLRCRSGRRALLST